MFHFIFNLPLIGEVIEKAVFQQWSRFLTWTDRFDVRQSGFRGHHSAEAGLDLTKCSMISTYLPAAERPQCIQYCYTSVQHLTLLTVTKATRELDLAFW